MRPLAYVLRFVFYLLYHPFAWSYDLVSATVSLGRWQDWVRTVVPFVEGSRVLELGHGPGHLQRLLRSRGLLAVGLDESPQMGRLAKKLLSGSGYTQCNLSRALAQSLPFPAETFDSIISTFPSNYIFDPNTLLEVRRTLKNGGRFIMLPVAWIIGNKLLERYAAALFRVTGQAPTEPVEIISQRFKQPFIDTGFKTKIEQVEVKSSLVLIVIAEKKPNSSLSGGPETLHSRKDAGTV
jgi:ubiquinone/menaquinone biosynthesis C-methylase UbiE